MYLYLAAAGAAVGCAAQAPHWGAFLVAGQSTGSRTQAELLRSVWDLPGPGLNSGPLHGGTLNHWTTREAP